MLRPFCRILDFAISAVGLDLDALWMYSKCAHITAGSQPCDTLNLAGANDMESVFFSNASKALGLLFTLLISDVPGEHNLVETFQIIPSTAQRNIEYISYIKDSVMTDLLSCMWQTWKSKYLSIQSHGSHLHCLMLYLFVLCHSTKQINCSRPSQCRPTDWAWYFAVKTNYQQREQQ